MAVFTVVKRLGSGQTYTTGNGWNAGAPADLTTAERWTAGTFVGTFTQGETVTGTGLTAGKFLDSDGSTYVCFGITTGNSATLVTLTGASSGATCVVSAKTHTGIIWQGQINAASDSFTGSSGTTLITIGGSTSSATCYKELSTATGASWRDNSANAIAFNTSQGCYISTSNTYSDVLTITEQYVHLTNLQVAATGANHTSAIECALAQPNIVCTNCIFEATGQGSAYRGVLDCQNGAPPITMYNCITILRASAQSYIASLFGGYKLYGSLFAVPSDLTAATNFLFTDSTAGSIVENCVVMGVTTLNQAGTPTNTTNFTSASSPPAGWTGSVANSSSTFVNTTNASRNYRLVSGSALLNVGTTDSTNDGVDVFGTARPSGAAYDVGPHELVSASSALTGTVTTATEADIVAGGKTIILTLTNDTWVASGATFDGQRANIIAGLTSAGAEATGWNAVVKALQGVAGVVRTSSTVVTITLDAQATYDITANETITVTIPSTAVVGAVAIVASPTFTITATAASGPKANQLYGAFNPTKGYIS